MKISVITAVRNNRDTLAAALDSVLAQTHPDIEHIVIDGASTDGTLDLLQTYAGHLAVLVSEKDSGIYEALNKGLARASGEVIGFLHADDLLNDASVLADIAQAFADPAVAGVYGDLQYVRKAATEHVVRHWRSGAFNSDLLRQGWMPPHPTLYLRRAVYERHGNFDTSYRIAADYDFMLRILKPGNLQLVHLPRVLVKMSAGGASNRSLKNIIRKMREDLRALHTNKVGGLAVLLRKNLSKLSQFLHTPP